MRITRWGEFGILCCLFLAKKHSTQGAVGASEISKTQAIPIQYTQQILQRLRKGGIIKSVRGPHGGYRLTKSPEETNLKAILNSVEGATFEVFCEVDPVYESFCVNNLDCSLRFVWHDLKQTIDAFLENQSLSNLIERQKKASQERGQRELIEISSTRNRVKRTA